MNENVVVLAVAATVLIFVSTEILAAVLPIVVVVLLVPHEERAALADLIAAADRSRKLRLWPALRISVSARRRLGQTRDGQHHRAGQR